MNRCKCVLTAVLSGFLLHASAQDTLRISISNADKVFLEKNLLFAAGKLNVDVQKAYEIQARLYPNPEINFAVNAFDNDNRKPFNAGRDGQKTFQFQQLVLLGGKRKNQARLAGENTRQASFELENLLRNLKYELHTSMYSLHFDLRTLGKYDIQLGQLDTIIRAYESQAAKGNIPLKEVVRLKSVFIRLNNDKTALLKTIQQQQKDLQLLLQTDSFVFPDISAEVSPRFQKLLGVDSLTNLAFGNRQDLQASQLGQSIADLNLKYQKSLAVPDLTLGTAYDQRGGAFSNEFNLTVGLPLPLWNRNQGGIKAAQAQQKYSALNIELAEQMIETEVRQAWANMNRSIQEYRKITEVYNTDFASVYEGMQINFLKRNISLVEFVDFFESYSETVAEVYEIRKQLMLSAENINYITAYEVY